MDKKFSLNSVELQEFQPNRYPFLMIDYVDEVLPGKYARGYKNMTLNEWFFPYDHIKHILIIVPKVKLHFEARTTINILNK